jgi:predicted O-methyltransferase YrrM
MSIKDHFLHWLRNSEEYKNLVAENNRLNSLQGYPPGHFYSPVVDGKMLERREAEIWGDQVRTFQGIELNVNEQLELVKTFNAYYPELPYLPEKELKTRYYFDNDYYTHNDGITLYSMIRHLAPKKIIEIGSGFSSAIMLDTNEHCFSRSIKLCFIDPYPERLFGLLNEHDKQHCQVIVTDVQAVPLELYKDLEAGDILFVDSSHVVKTGSDLHHILFNILPVLKPGVHIHFHDIFFPFEYPKAWVMAGRNWNENYVLRAFLMYNDKFRIRLFSDYLYKEHTVVYWDLPLAYNVQGTSLWIEKTG